MTDLLKDAQDFIDSVKAFSTPERAAKYAKPPSIQNQNQPVLQFRTEPSPNSIFPVLKLTDFRREAITFIETFFFSNKKLPSVYDFKQHFSASPDLLPKSPADWQDFFSNVEEGLRNRGIPVYEAPPGYLEPNFVLAVNLIINPYDRRSVAAKLKEAGLTTKQWNGLLRLPPHHEYYKRRLDQIFDDDLQNDAKLALSRLIQAGDLQAIKHYHELQNIYRPQTNQDLRAILMAIMEILTLHVSPEVIGKVAESLRNSPQLQAIEVQSR